MATASYLVDTGAIVAYLDRDDQWHKHCFAAYPHLPLPLLTSTAVLTELFHMMSRRPVELAIVWRFVRSGALAIGPITNEDFPHLYSLMSQYEDHPMDFADATLVRLAQRESITRIFTVDADFETYRIGGRRRFTIVPSTRP
ncbi:MAG TPA: PIN domain-containing protein [Bryobacteraceae bacterium]|jgi:hypothetical protein